MKPLSQTALVCTCMLTAIALFTPIRDRSIAQAARAADDTAALLAQQPIGPLLGKQVVFGVNAPPDPAERVGILEAADATWVRIRTKDGQLRCYPAASMSYVFLANEGKP
jgi:hypothetical protein